ncbi:hypothetical protein [Micromonospora sp. NPDC048947]|uniref:hypothetical protein n=1 Tax=Micromonospora sp. NPDC048947 TaxID=3154826 RepID=UPI0033CD1AC1
MGGEANLTTARHIGLSIEAGGASEPARFILLLGTSRHECVLEPDEVVFDVGGRHRTRMYMLEQWIAHLHGLRTTRGGTVMLPYHFADQCGAWLRVTSPDGVTAEVQAGWSLLSEFGVFSLTTNAPSSAKPRAFARSRTPLRGEDVVGVAVEVLAGSVVTHGGSGVRVAGGDLQVSEADARVEHGGHEGVAQSYAARPDERAAAARTNSRNSQRL